MLGGVGIASGVTVVIDSGFDKDATESCLCLNFARTNQRSTGSKQHPPSMRLGVLSYCYATGSFFRRRIETLTFSSLAVL